MPLVRNRVVDGTGQPVAGVTVSVSLSTRPAYIADGSLVRPVSTITDQDGVWELDLVANTAIVPAGTHWRVHEAGQLSTIVVPTDQGPHELTDLLVAEPAPVPGLGVSSVDGMTGAVLLDDRYVGRIMDLSEWDDQFSVTHIGFDAGEAPPAAQWPNRMEKRISTQDPPENRLVQYENERREWRGACFGPAPNGLGPSTVGWRLFAAHTEAAYAARNPDLPVWEIAGWRTGAGSHETLIAAYPGGEMEIRAGEWVELVLADDVLADDPANPPRARLEVGRQTVLLAGVLDPQVSMSPGEVLATVPVGLRPTRQQRLSVRTGPLPGLTSGSTAIVDTDGTITWTTGTLGAGGGMGLDGLAYPLD